LISVRVAVGLAEGENALMVAGSCCLGQVPLGLDLGSDPGTRLAEPWLGLERALGDPELEHPARPAQRLAHGAAAVDLLARHLGTSWKPPSTSRTSQPWASIESRRRSAHSKSRAARAASRSSASSTTPAGASGSAAEM